MKPYNTYFWKHRYNFYNALASQSLQYNCLSEIKPLILSAVYDDRWNPFEDFDGCTGINDPYQPCVWCFIHDWMWKTGQGGIVSDRIMKNLAIKHGVSKFRASIYFMIVRTAWVTYYRFKHSDNKSPLHRLVLKYYLKHIKNKKW